MGFWIGLAIGVLTCGAVFALFARRVRRQVAELEGDAWRTEQLRRRLFHMGCAARTWVENHARHGAACHRGPILGRCVCGLSQLAQAIKEAVPVGDETADGLDEPRHRGDGSDFAFRSANQPPLQTNAAGWLIDEPRSGDIYEAYESARRQMMDQFNSSPQNVWGLSRDEIHRLQRFETTPEEMTSIERAAGPWGSSAIQARIESEYYNRRIQDNIRRMMERRSP